MYRHHHCRHNNDNSGMGCIVALILGLLAMPLVGLYMLIAGDDAGKKVVGLILTIVGLIFWMVAL